ncbi:hypothetical protein [Sulfitobacter pontiacus]|uniref:hypothetical protein n=1 Tax=Sulfitobacter pontiacus TaxID=60137 RepID=UPI00275B97FA|nr:hypothetical protein [Sulfitobacter pontiacus]GLO78509.1 hypothetical protein MACH23_19300 [Sulfitobacter pontiacus]
MAILRNPYGIQLNDITVKRKRLTLEDAVTAHILRHQGVSYTDIVQMLGTNANRVGDVFRGRSFPEAAMIALRWLTKKTR